MTRRTLVIGAGGLIGAAVCTRLRERGHEVVEASRSSGEQVDLRDPDSVAALYARVGPVDGVVAATGAVPFKPFAELTVEDFRAGLEDKVLGQIGVVTLGADIVRPGGSFTLTSGVLGSHPIATGTAASAANGALESFVVAAATGLSGGRRINAVSPNVLADAPALHDSFPGFVPVPTELVVQAYVRSIEGVETGLVLSV